jgi:hypothetical protein
MGLQDRDYMKRDVQQKEIKRTIYPKKTSFWEMILKSTILLGFIFLIIKLALELKNYH